MGKTRGEQSTGAIAAVPDTASPGERRALGDGIDDRAPLPRTIQPRTEKLFLSICLFASFFIALMSSVWTDSPLGLVFAGYLPIIIAIILLLAEVEQGYKQGVYWATPFLTSILFLTIGGLLNPVIGNQLNVGALTVINLVLGLLVVLLLTIIEGGPFLRSDPPEPELKPNNLSEYLHSIEDKCKALNFVVGRVYRGSNGATDAMRARLRIEKEWYNEFNAIIEGDISKQRHEAIVLLHKMRDRLQLMTRKEKEVFTAAELRALKNLVRHQDGEDSIIDVLVVNDRDPVQHYYVGAVDGVEKLLAHLGAE